MRDVNHSRAHRDVWRTPAGAFGILSADRPFWHLTVRRAPQWVVVVDAAGASRVGGTTSRPCAARTRRWLAFLSVSAASYARATSSSAASAATRSRGASRTGYGAT